MSGYSVLKILQGPLKMREYPDSRSRQRRGGAPKLFYVSRDDQRRDLAHYSWLALVAVERGHVQPVQPARYLIELSLRGEIVELKPWQAVG